MLDQLLLLLLLLFALFLRYILPLLGDWRQSREQEGLPTGKRTTPSRPPVLIPVPLPSIPKVPSSRVGKQATARPIVAPAMIPRGHRRLQMLRRHDARHGIVLMTILGPCRALEAPQPPQ
jgi:hypothetical protein